MTAIMFMGGASTNLPPFIPFNDELTASGSRVVPIGASALMIETWSGGGGGGNGATGSNDHGGGGGASGAYAKSVLSLVGGDAGKTITVTISGKNASTSGPAVNGGAVTTTTVGGSDGGSASGTTNGTGGNVPGTASGGNTTNTNGANGAAGDFVSGGVGAAAINGRSAGGHGGFSVSNSGKTSGVAPFVRLSWS